jgi:S-phase kinase-associated protein 1
MDTIKLMTSDGMIVEMSKEIACKCGTITNMLDDITDGSMEHVPLPNVSETILNMIIKYSTYHNENGTEHVSEDIRDVKIKDIDAWDAEFCKVDQSVLFELILAANYLELKPLLDLTCRTVADMIRGKTPEQIRQTFNIKNDFTPEEEAQVIKDNEWCEEAK